MEVVGKRLTCYPLPLPRRHSRPRRFVFRAYQFAVAHGAVRPLCLANTGPVGVAISSCLLFPSSGYTATPSDSVAGTGLGRVVRLRPHLLPDALGQLARPGSVRPLQHQCELLAP